jgi:hypothetical protein
MLRKRLAGLLLILPLMVGLSVAAYKYGPSPARSAEPVAIDPATAAQPATATAPANSRLFELFGMYETAVAKGHVHATPTDYLNSLEAIYRQRGYQLLEAPRLKVEKKKKTKARAVKENLPAKFFQREESDGIGNISATGDDADFGSSNPAVTPYTFSTIVTAASGGGCDWATYRIGIAPAGTGQLGDLEHGDFPGGDPVEVPRLAGLQRIYSMTSGSGSLAIYKTTEGTQATLVLRYMDEMRSRGWQLDTAATADANKVASGVMCFMRGSHSCLIWITPSKQGGGTNVTISSH